LTGQFIALWYALILKTMALGSPKTLSNLCFIHWSPVAPKVPDWVSVLLKILFISITASLNVSPWLEKPCLAYIYLGSRIMSRNKIWVIDDDRAMRWVLEKTFKEEGLDVTSFEEAQSALDQLSVDAPDVILTDIRMPGIDGLTFLGKVKHNYPDLPVIIMTAHSDLESAVSSYQTGAFEYLPKPFDIDEALALVNRAILHITKLQQQESAKVAPPIQSTEIIGESPAMQEVFRAIGRLAQSHITVLINGESGTGKELVAHALHRHSPRSSKPFIALNMAAIPKDLIETELFGHEKGAFTGANTQRQGR